MRRSWKPALGGVLLAASLALMAQAPAPTPGLSIVAPGTSPMQQRSTQPARPSLFSLFGLPVVVDAPVPPPYCGCTYETYFGQPMRSAGAVAAQSSGVPRGQ